MAKKEKGGSQTELPTQKRLRDARKEGDIHKSRELTSTVVVLVWLLMGWMLGPLVYRELATLFDLSFVVMGESFSLALAQLVRPDAQQRQQ